MPARMRRSPEVQEVVDTLLYTREAEIKEGSSTIEARVNLQQLQSCRRGRGRKGKAVMEQQQRADRMCRDIMKKYYDHWYVAARSLMKRTA